MTYNATWLEQKQKEEKTGTLGEQIGNTFYLNVKNENNLQKMNIY